MMHHAALVRARRRIRPVARTSQYADASSGTSLPASMRPAAGGGAGRSMLLTSLPASMRSNNGGGSLMKGAF